MPKRPASKKDEAANAKKVKQTKPTSLKGKFKPSAAAGGDKNKAAPAKSFSGKASSNASSTKSNKAAADKDDKPARKPSFKGKGKPGSKKPKAPTLTPKERKEKRKQSKPFFEALSAANEVWKKQLSKMKTKAEREECVGDVLTSITGQIADIAAKHDAARVLQTILKYGTEAHRNVIIAELKGKLLSLSANQYGHWLVMKLIKYGSDTTKQTIANELIGNLRKLALHAFGAKTLDVLYSNAPHVLQASLLFEFYGNEFSLFRETILNKTQKADNAPLVQKGQKPDPHSLVALVGESQIKADQVIATLSAYFDRVIFKKHLGFRFNHALLAEYFKLLASKNHAPALTGSTVSWTASEIETERRRQKSESSLVEALSPAIMSLFSTPEGASVACTCFALGTTKDRKAAMRAIKGGVLDMAQHAEGHLVLMRALDSIDDTVLLNKTIIAELLPQLDDLVAHPFASKVLLHLLRPGFPAYNRPEVLHMLSPSLLLRVQLPAAAKDSTSLVTGQAAGAEDDDEEDDDEEDPEVLRNAQAAADNSEEYEEANAMADEAVPPATTENAVAPGHTELTVASTSKKAPEVRRTEILAATLPALLAVFDRYVQKIDLDAEPVDFGLLDDTVGSPVLTETLREAADRCSLPAFMAGAAAFQRILAALAKFCGNANIESSLLQCRLGHLLIKHLLLGMNAERAAAFASSIVAELSPETVAAQACTNRGAFVFSAILETGVEAKLQLAALLRPCVEQIGKFVAERKGCATLLDVLAKIPAANAKPAAKAAAAKAPAGKATPGKSKKSGRS